jgi:serine/threonine protein kinase
LKHPLKDYKGFLFKVESGIRHLHSLGLIYNNIKPANIILNDDDNPIIIDFNNYYLNRQDLEGISGTWL